MVLGSKSDLEIGKKVTDILKKFGVNYKMHIASAHRTPERVVEIVEESDCDVYIAIAGLSAALPGVMAAHTTKPIIGLPVSGKVPLDSLLSMVQMPPGIPIGVVGVDNAKNAALLSLSILSIKNKDIETKLKEYRLQMKDSILKDSTTLESM